MGNVSTEHLRVLTHQGRAVEGRVQISTGDPMLR